MKKIKELFFEFRQDKYKVSIFFILVFLAVFTPLFLKPEIAGDSLLYTSSIDVLKTGVRPEGFMPMMILTTYLGLRLIMFLDLFFNNISISWMVLDGILFVSMGIFFYSLVRRMFESSKTAFISTLLLTTNYGATAFGLAYMMDMGGWLAYVASIYFSYRYLESYCKENKWLYIASLIIGLGGLYKEYAFIAYVIVFGVIVWGSWKKWTEILRKVFITGVLAFTPFAVMNVYTFMYFNGYTYWDWLTFQKVYAYQNRVVEFIKSFGSIYNFGWLIFAPGLYILLKRLKETLHDKNLVFIWLTLLSCLSVLVWPVVTRVLFITMPAVVLITTLFIEKLKKPFYLIFPVLVMYILCCFFMDSYVLDHVNVDPFFSLFR